MHETFRTSSARRDQLQHNKGPIPAWVEQPLKELGGPERGNSKYRLPTFCNSPRIGKTFSHHWLNRKSGSQFFPPTDKAPLPSAQINLHISGSLGNLGSWFHPPLTQGAELKALVAHLYGRAWDAHGVTSVSILFLPTQLFWTHQEPENLRAYCTHNASLSSFFGFSFIALIIKGFSFCPSFPTMPWMATSNELAKGWKTLKIWANTARWKGEKNPWTKKSMLCSYTVFFSHQPSTKKRGQHGNFANPLKGYSIMCQIWGNPKNKCTQSHLCWTAIFPSITHIAKDEFTGQLFPPTITQ